MVSCGPVNERKHIRGRQVASENGIPTSLAGSDRIRVKSDCVMNREEFYQMAMAHAMLCGAWCNGLLLMLNYSYVKDDTLPIHSVVVTPDPVKPDTISRDHIPDQRNTHNKDRDRDELVLLTTGRSGHRLLGSQLASVLGRMAHGQAGPRCLGF